MPCTRDLNYQTDNGTIPNTTSFTKCRKYKPFLPSFTPTIDYLSVTSSRYKKYSLVYITGSNFLPPVYGNTYVNFGDSFTDIPITFYSCFNISFVVPLNAFIGEYKVKVVNIYNGNFSPGVNTTYPGIPNYSNSITYTIY
jgi:hypothetical protein